MRGVVQVDGEAVCFVAVGHVAEHVVVDVAEEVDLGLHAPVIPRVSEGRVMVEKAGVPAAHLVVGDQVPILDVLFFEYLRRFDEQVVIYPRGDGPVFFGYQFCWVGGNVSFCGCVCLRVMIP